VVVEASVVAAEASVEVGAVDQAACAIPGGAGTVAVLDVAIRNSGTQAKETEPSSSQLMETTQEMIAKPRMIDRITKETKTWETGKIAEMIIEKTGKIIKTKIEKTGKIIVTTDRMNAKNMLKTTITEADIAMVMAVQLL